MYYEDDHFHPNNIDEDEFDFQVREPSLCSESTGLTSYTVNSYRKKQRKAQDEYKMIDKDYRKLKIRVDIYTKKDIELYVTNSTPGHMIRDAITGARHKEYLVGSRNEDLFFKVKMPDHISDISSPVIFFMSPEQYERHMYTTLSTQVKEKWENKFNAARALQDA